MGNPSMHLLKDKLFNGKRLHFFNDAICISCALRGMVSSGVRVFSAMRRPTQVLHPLDSERFTFRSTNGLPTLVNAFELTQAALRHSNDMADNNFTDHTGSDGTNGGDRIKEACFKGTGWGEIIGWGFDGKTSRMIKWWMNSPPHRSIILSEGFDVFGAGYAKNSKSKWEHYWTVNFSQRVSEEDSMSGKRYICQYMYQGEKGGSLMTINSLKPCEQLFSFSTD